MTRKSDRPERPAQASSPDLGLLLDEIEQERVPDRLLALAQELQKKLAEKRRQERAEDCEEPAAPGRVRRSR